MPLNQKKIEDSNLMVKALMRLTKAAWEKLLKTWKRSVITPEPKKVILISPITPFKQIQQQKVQ